MLTVIDTNEGGEGAGGWEGGWEEEEEEEEEGERGQQRRATGDVDLIGVAPGSVAVGGGGGEGLSCVVTSMPSCAPNQLICIEATHRSNYPSTV